MEKIDSLEWVNLQQQKKLRNMKIFWTVVAAAAAIIGIYHVYFLNLAPSPYDLVVYSQSELLADADASMRVRLVNCDTGAPVEGATVRIGLVRHSKADGEKIVSLANFTTDHTGSGQPKFRVPDWDNTSELRILARKGLRREQIARTVHVKQTAKLMLSTDKPIYQPGQTIRLRSLALRSDLKPVGRNKSVRFEILDPKGNVVFKHDGLTSRFGIASADCPLASEIIEGPYTIQCEMFGRTSSKTVDVKSYVLPKFKSNVAPIGRPFSTNRLGRFSVS